MKNPICCFCGKECDCKFGNNPEPLMSHPNVCCDYCNLTQVIPARIAGVKRKKPTNQKIYVPISEEELQELMAGRTFTWTFAMKDGTPIDIELKQESEV